MPYGRRYSLLELTALDGGLAFHGLDKNRDGVITLDESPRPASFHETDTDQDGAVTREEFKARWKQRSGKSPGDR